MKLKEIFSKPVDRNIEGVIKADDQSSLLVEVDEYVLTNEVAQRLETFLDAYNQNPNSNGVWISGFFGSGKSHLLKILALILGNHVIDDKPVIDRFLTKCTTNAILRGGLQRAVSIPSQSILFNIDQKADIITTNQVDALLSVFVKVFNEACGYYGKQGYIANFERDLEMRGLLPAFKLAYQSIAGIPWDAGREQALLEGENISRAYSQVTGGTEDASAGILDKYRSDYKVSIEDFAIQVNNYIERQPANFRLNFFVDEVGQYIANSVRLMTNLQTIAESLATKCRGRAWIIVTSQQQIDDVVGEMKQRQANDFTKIMGRFATKMTLTSQNVAEVIQKRLLAKNKTGIPLLTVLYEQQFNHFGTLFDFRDGSRAYLNFRDHQHFLDSYPFPPYQFELFQAAIQRLSEHNAFEGRHSSVGERSMLAVFQEVAKIISDHEIGQLATFDLMFEGIRVALKSKVQQSILTAENNLHQSFAVRVLKALFLVKYVKEFKATPHNIAILMTERFGQDISGLRRQVEEALNLLEQQTYIQRTGDLYEFLTNEEKDVEEEIKNTEVDSDSVAKELDKIIFDTIFRENKIRLDDSTQNFSFARKLDDHLMGRDNEIAIHVISPFHDQIDQIEMLQSHSLGRDELLIVLPNDPRLMQDLLMYKRTEKYIQQNNTINQQDTRRTILAEKQTQNQDRLKNLELKLKDLLGKARYFVAGQEIDLPSGDAQSRMVRGAQDLVRRAYPNLRMLRNITYQENEIGAYLRPTVGTLFTDGNGLSEVESELLGTIAGNARSGVRTTVKSIVDKFQRKPYGWPLPAILCNLAGLSARGKVEMRQDGNLLEDTALERALRNTQAHQSVVLEPQVEFTTGQLRKLKEFFEDFFDQPAASNEARDLGKETAKALSDRLRGLEDMANHRSLYPFLTALDGPITALREVVEKPYTYFLTDFTNLQTQLLDFKEAIIAPVMAFWNGPQKNYYDQARQFQHDQRENFAYLANEEVTGFVQLLTTKDIYKGDGIQRLRGAVDNLKGRIDQLVLAEQCAASERISQLRAHMTQDSDWEKISPAQQVQLTTAFDRAAANLGEQRLIAVIRDHLHRFETQDYPRLLTQMANWAMPKPPIGGGGGGDVVEPPVEYILSSTISVGFGKPWLASPTDLEAYLAALHAAYQKEIEKGKRIKLP